jgi:hypothetical protein
MLKFLYSKKIQRKECFKGWSNSPVVAVHYRFLFWTWEDIYWKCIWWEKVIKKDPHFHNDGFYSVLFSELAPYNLSIKLDNWFKNNA